MYVDRCFHRQNEIDRLEIVSRQKNWCVKLNGKKINYHLSLRIRKFFIFVSLISSSGKIFIVVFVRFFNVSSPSFRTLYCAKNNYEFGISRVMKSLEPYQKKLGTDTWFYTKRCFLSLFENMARHSVIIRDQVLMEMLHFLSHCESKSSRFQRKKDEIIEQCFPFRLGSWSKSEFRLTIIH